MKRGTEDKRERRSAKEIFLEVILELLLYLVCFTVGGLILLAFDKNALNMDFELVVLIGLGVFATFAFAVCFIIYRIKKKRSKSEPPRKDNDA